MTALKVLLVDDDKNIRTTLRASLMTHGCTVSVAVSAEEAFPLARTGEFDLVLTDFRMEGKSGVDLIRDCRGLSRPPLIVIMTAFASFENAVMAIQAGAFDYLPKPFSTVQLGHLLGKIATVVELKRENEALRASGVRLDYFRGMISPAMQRLEDAVAKVAPTEATVLLTGESGTGKSELARTIHGLSPRAARPFIVVNCAALTESLLESELFGHARGAFTGATTEHVGKLELAQGGTVLIDEIGELSAAGQTKLLRFLQERVIERVGSNRAISLDVRVIAATNRKLDDAVVDGTFREDLYYRLNVFQFDVVPLRFRKEDVGVLVEKFAHEFSAKAKLASPIVLSPAVRILLLEHAWPGNLRELRNVLERLAFLSAGREPVVEDLPDAVRFGSATGKRAGGSSGPPLIPIEDVVRNHIEAILRVESNQERAAEILGITTVTLWRKRKEYGLP